MYNCITIMVNLDGEKESTRQPFKMMTNTKPNGKLFMSDSLGLAAHL